jgi:dihydrodipicolinate synthase/N-acetylneuraminate lyase
MIGGNWTALLTPFDKNGNIKTEQADALVGFYQKQRADGVYLLGFTGEGSVMNADQRKEWAEAVVKAARGKMHAFVHVGYSSDPKVGIELARHAASIGAEAVSSVGLSKETMLDENMAYFKAVSEASGLPFYVYWNAFGGNLNGGKRLDPRELIDALKKNVPTFKGFKYTDSNFYYMDRIKQIDKDVVVFTGVDQMCVAGRLMGSDGSIGALQAVTCLHFAMMLDKLASGDVKGAMEMQICANNIYEALDEREIGSLIPGLKFVMKEFYGVDVGEVCPGTDYHSITDAAIGKRLLERFTKNIYKG